MTVHDLRADMPLHDQYKPLLSAASFAARAHRHQLRKDRETPYAAHPFRVCLIARHIFGIDDPLVLATALLHDTIEDTTTDRDDLVEHFGSEIAASVAALSKDMRLPDAEREEKYKQTLRTSPAPVKICKLADIFDNLIDSLQLSRAQRQKTIERSQTYLAALENDIPDAVQPTLQIVKNLLLEVENQSG